MFMKNILITSVLLFTCLCTYAQLNAPVLSTVSDFTIKEGQLKEFYITATDADFGVAINNPKIVVMGSSTTVGRGASSENTNWYALFDQYLTAAVGNHTLIKLAQSGYSSYEFREDGFIPALAGRPLPDINRNITKALSYNPDIIIVNIPSNDVANGYSNEEFYSNLTEILNIASAEGVKVYFHTTQPRNTLSLDFRYKLFEQSEYIKTHYPNIVVTYDSLADLSTFRINDNYNFDGIHVNDLGHAIIYRQTKKALRQDLIGDSLKFTFSGLPSFVTVSTISKDSIKLIVNPSFQQAGVYQVQVQVEDLLGHKHQQSFKITVQDNQSLSGQQLLTNFHYNLNSGGQMDYYVYYPDDYDLFPENRPVLISIHGAAERAGSPTSIIGDDLGGGSPANLINHGASLPMMVFSPHQQSFIGGVYNQTWNIQVLKEFVEHIKSTYSIDENKIFITGFSNGAQAAWQYAVDYPEDVAALVAISGRTDLTGQSFNVNLQNSQYACKLSGIPIQVWHGSNDVIINSSHSQNMVNAINQCIPAPLPPVKYTLINGMNHDDSRPFVYSNITGSDNIYDWMLQVEKGQIVVDLTPPIFLNNTPQYNGLDEDKFNFQVDFNEKSKMYYAVYTTQFTPTLNQIKQGVGSGLVSYGVVDDIYSTNVSLSNLNPSTTYYVWIQAEDKAPEVNVQPSATLLNVTTLDHVVDTQSPIFIQQPTIVAVTSGNVRISSRLDEAGTLYWALYKANENPSVDDVILGNNAIQYGTEISDLNLVEWEVQSLIKESTYKLAIVAADDAAVPNVQSEVTTLLFTTPAQTAGINLIQTYKLNITPANYQSGLSDWNDLGFDNINKSKVFSNIKSITNQTATFSLIAYSGMEGSTINAVSDNGTGYGEGVYPANVLRHAVYSTGTSKLFFQNMSSDKVYTFSIMGSRNGSGSRKTKYTLNGTEQLLECMNNKQDVVVYDKVAPNASGEFAFEMTKNNASWSYLNAIVIEEFTQSNGDTVSPQPVIDFGVNYDENNKTISLTWGANTEADFSSYLVYKSTELITSSNLLDNLKNGKIIQNNFIDTDLEEGGLYYYWVRVLDLAGNYSPLSSVLQVQIPSGVIIDTSSITPPLSVQATSDTEKININWLPSVDSLEERYLIYRSVNNEQAVVIDTVNVPMVSYEDQAVVYGMLYTYWVSGVDSLGTESALSDSVEIELKELIVAPSAPQELVYTQLSDTLIELSWSQVVSPGFLNYKVSVWLYDFDVFIAPYRTYNSLVDTSFVIDLDLSATEYFFTVTAINKLGEESSYSSVLTIKSNDWEAPEAVIMNNTTALSNAIGLTWEGSQADDVENYHVYRSENQILQPLSTNYLATVVETSYIDESISSGTFYYYLIVSEDTAGNLSVPSNIVSGTSLDNIPPNTPTELSVSIGENSWVQLSWYANVEADLLGYKVWKSTAVFSDTSEADLLTVSSSTSWSDVSVEEGITYYYGITAFDNLGNESALSSVSSVFIPDVTAPKAPVLLFANSNDIGVELIWNKNQEADVVAYQLYASTNSTISEILNEESLQLIDTSYQYNITSLNEGVLYYFIITASDTAGNVSEKSNILSGYRLNVTPPIAPTNLQLHLISENAIELDWDNATEVDFAYYQVFRNDELLVDNLTASYYLDESLAYDSDYIYYITSVDSEGNKSIPSESISQQTGTAPTVDESEIIKVNASSTVGSPFMTGWNNIVFNIGVKQQVIYDLYDVENNLTGKTLTVWNGFDGSTINSISNNGTSLNNGVYPDLVLQYAVYTTGTGRFSLNGLTPNFVYDIEIQSGRSGGGSRKTVFEVNDFTQEIESMNNNMNTLLFENISADNNGEITISFSKSNSSWGYLNGLVITEKSTSSSNRTAKKYDNNATSELTVYPNPSLGTLIFETNNSWDEGSTLVITDLEGKVLISENINIGSRYVFDSQLETGVYILRLTNSSQSFVRQIIIEE